MTPIREQVDTMIRRLKAQDSMEGVRFFRAYSDESIETPIQGFSAVVGVIKAEQKQGFAGGLAAPGVRGSLYSAEVELRVFAPYRQSGEGLSELVSAMLIGLERADEERLITAASASSIEFDSELNCVFRRLCFTLEFCLCEEGIA